MICTFRRWGEISGERWGQAIDWGIGDCGRGESQERGGDGG